MPEENTPTDYGNMYVPENEPQTDPTPVSEEPIDPASEPILDSEDTFVSVNIDGGGNLRLREEPVDGVSLSLIPNETALKVISADNPEWLFVEYANGDDEPLRGYVKGSLVTEITE